MPSIVDTEIIANRNKPNIKEQVSTHSLNIFLKQLIPAPNLVGIYAKVFETFHYKNNNDKFIMVKKEQ